ILVNMRKVTVKIILAALLAIFMILPGTSFAAFGFSSFMGSAKNFTASLLDVFFPKDLSTPAPAEQQINFDPERAREQNNADELANGISNPLEPAPAGLQVNVPSAFKGDVKFGGQVSVGGNAAVVGFLTASSLSAEQAVISRSLTAPNIIYEIKAGEGLEISGDRQRPVLSVLFWEIATTSPSTSTELILKEPFTSLIIPGNISANHISTKSLDVSDLTINTRLAVGGEFDVSGKVIFRGEFIEAKATTTFVVEKSMLFLVSTSSGKVFQINTSTSSADSLFSVGGNNDGEINIGGFLNVSKLLTAEGPLTVKGALIAQGEATFENSATNPSLKGCDGFSVLETDATGKIVCGKDDKGLGAGGTISSGASGHLTYYSDSTTLDSSSFLVAQNGNFGIATSTPTPISEDGTGGLLAVGGTGTSTFMGGVSVKSFASAGSARLTNLLNCNGVSLLETNALGDIVCGADGGSGGVGITTLNGPPADPQSFAFNNPSSEWTSLSVSSVTATHTFTLIASTSPAYGFIVATSTTRTSEFLGGLRVMNNPIQSSSTATSTFAGEVEAMR